MKIVFLVKAVDRDAVGDFVVCCYLLTSLLLHPSVCQTRVTFDNFLAAKVPFICYPKAFIMQQQNPEMFGLH